MDQIHEKHKELTLLTHEINQKALTFNGVSFFFSPSLVVSFTSFEVCFKDYVLYLYSLFIELPGANLKFIDKKIKDFDIPLNKNGKNISRLVQDLRTVRGHYTSIEKPKDREKINACEDWFNEITSVKKIEKEEDYKKCIHALLDGTIEYLKSVLLCIKHFSKVEYPDIIREDWQRYTTRTFSKYQWEMQLQSTLEMYGMNHFEPHLIIEKEFSKWNEQLKILKDGFSFEVEAKRIIERFITQEDIWPASAEDLYKLGIPKGKEMGEMIKRAKEMYHNDPCNKEELLKRFKKKYLE